MPQEMQDAQKPQATPQPGVDSQRQRERAKNQPPQKPTDTLDPSLPTVVVDAGETLWDIAAAVYGDGRAWIDLWNANRARVPNAHALRPGTVLVLPPLQDKTHDHPLPPPDDPQPLAPAHAKQHTVRAGETLIAIATAELGESGRWSDIWDLNRAIVPNPDRLRVGQVLILPEPRVRQPVRQDTPNPVDKKATDKKPEPVPNQPTNVPPPLPQDRKRAEGKTPTERLAAALYNEKGPLIAEQAGRIGIETGVAAACMLTETGGRRQKSGQMTIRFEPAVFKRYTKREVADTHAGQVAEWRAFEEAKAIDETAAFDSISMGIAQIMGFNAGRLGYPDAKTMFAAMSASEDTQAVGFFEFIRTSRALLKAAQEKDWPTFARLYNGPAYAKNAYDVKMATYYAAWQRVTAGLAG